MRSLSAVPFGLPPVLALTVVLALSGCQTTTTAENAAPLSVAFADSAWTGISIPARQQCRRFGGQGATPALTVSGVPKRAEAVVVSFNDESYAAMNGGGHGVLRFAVGDQPTVTLPSVPGETDALPQGVTVVAPHRSVQWFGTAGAYGPPCSGGKGNLYSADVQAVDGDGDVLAAGKIVLGRY